MKSFEIIMTPDAISDLVGLRNYIADALLASETALTYIHAIRQEISKLEYMAASIAPIRDEPWHSKCIRKIIVKNFYINYRIDDTTRRSAFAVN